MPLATLNGSLLPFHYECPNSAGRSALQPGRWDRLRCLGWDGGDPSACAT